MKRLPILFIAFFFSCSQEPRLFAGDKDRIEMQVREVLHQYCADVRTKGMMAEFNYLDTSADFFWMPPGYRSPLSYADVAAVLTLTAPLYASINNRWDTLLVKPLTTNLVSYTGRIHSEMTDTTGKLSAYSLAETGLLIRRADGWKLLQGQTSVLP